MEDKRESKRHSLPFIHIALSRKHEGCTQTTLRLGRWGGAAESSRTSTPSLRRKRALRSLVLRWGGEGAMEQTAEQTDTSTGLRLRGSRGNKSQQALCVYNVQTGSSFKPFVDLSLPSVILSHNAHFNPCFTCTQMQDIMVQFCHHSSEEAEARGSQVYSMKA